MRTNNDLKRIGDSSPNPGGRQLSGWGLGYGAGRSQAQTYFHNKMGHSAVHEHLQTLRRWYKVKRREAPPTQPPCSSGALWSVDCFGCTNSRLLSVIAQKQMCAKYRTLPDTTTASKTYGLTVYIFYGIHAERPHTFSGKSGRNRRCRRIRSGTRFP